MFATDRDLLVLEPGLFREIAWPGQTLFDTPLGTVSASGDTASSIKGDFVAQDIGAGNVCVIEGVSVEVVERLSATQLRVSLLRERADGDIVPLPFDGSGQRLVITTFRQQIAHVHNELLRSVGIDGVGTLGVAAVESGAILNTDAFVLAESLGALAMIFAGASALVDDESVTWAKATMYRARYREERARLVAAIDLDGDGFADATRRVGTGAMRRG